MGKTLCLLAVNHPLSLVTPVAVQEARGRDGGHAWAPLTLTLPDQGDLATQLLNAQAVDIRGSCYTPSAAPFSGENSQLPGISFPVPELSALKEAALCLHRWTHVSGCRVASLACSPSGSTMSERCHLTNNSTQTGVLKKSKCFSTLFRSLAKSRYQNTTKRISEKIIPGNFTPRCRGKTQTKRQQIKACVLSMR